MRLVIMDDYDGVSEWSAKFIKKRIMDFAPTADRLFTLGLPTGLC
jgi:glucosamine-6-phosphate deaminase